MSFVFSGKEYEIVEGHSSMMQGVGYGAVGVPSFVLNAKSRLTFAGFVDCRATDAW